MARRGWFEENAPPARNRYGLQSAQEGFPERSVPGGNPRFNERPQAPGDRGALAPIQGFDWNKLQAGHTSDKYTPALYAFSRGLGAGVPIARNQLDPMVNYARQQGFPNARAVGDDKIDFGDGQGPIDVIQSNGSIWFQNGPDRFGRGGGTGGGAGGVAGAGGGAGGVGGAGGGAAGGGGGMPVAGGAGDPYGNFGLAPAPFATEAYGGPPSAPLPLPGYLQGPFQAPTGLTYTNDPGYLERLRLGEDAIQHSAAARGSILSGGTLKALERYGQDYASNEYQNVFNRALAGRGQNVDEYGLQARLSNQSWLNNYNTYLQNQAQRFGAYQANVRNRRQAQEDYWNQLFAEHQAGQRATEFEYQLPPG